MEIEKKIYQYLNYRKFLADLFDHYKKKEGLSLRKLAKKADFGSHSYFKQIIHGNRNISEKSIIKISRAFKLSESESKYFSLLVNFSQANNIDDKNLFYKKLNKFRARDPLYELEEAQYLLFSQWYHIPIRELVNMVHFKEDFNWIANYLNPPVTAEEAEKSIQLLLKLGLLKRDTNGELQQADPTITTGDEAKNIAVTNYHIEMLQLAKRSISETEYFWRDLSCLTIILSREEFLFIKKQISDFRKNILQYLRDRKSGEFPEEIGGEEKHLYQLNMQFFNLSKLIWKKPKKKS
jgi:uncharacterized protein (TIGR02147 family)